MEKTRLKSIRNYCLDCCCGQSKEVKSCPSTDCPLWPFRLGYGLKDRRSNIPTNISLPYGNSFQKVIWAKCRDCAETYREVRICPMTECPLYKYRLRKV